MDYSPEEPSDTDSKQTEEATENVSTSSNIQACLNDASSTSGAGISSTSVELHSPENKKARSEPGTSKKKNKKKKKKDTKRKLPQKKSPSPRKNKNKPKTPRRLKQKSITSYFSRTIDYSKVTLDEEEEQGSTEIIGPDSLGIIQTSLDQAGSSATTNNNNQSTYIDQQEYNLYLSVLANHPISTMSKVNLRSSTNQVLTPSQQLEYDQYLIALRNNLTLHQETEQPLSSSGSSDMTFGGHSSPSNNNEAGVNFELSSGDFRVFSSDSQDQIVETGNIRASSNEPSSSTAKDKASSGNYDSSGENKTKTNKEKKKCTSENSSVDDTVSHDIQPCLDITECGGNCSRIVDDGNNVNNNFVASDDEQEEEETRIFESTRISHNDNQNSSNSSETPESDEDDTNNNDDFAFKTVISMTARERAAFFQKLSPSKFLCTICKKIINSNNGIIQHLKKAHKHEAFAVKRDRRTPRNKIDKRLRQKGKQLCCRDCDIKPMSTLQIARNHWKLVHGNEFDAPATCQFTDEESGLKCGQRHLAPCKLKAHMAAVHNIGILKCVEDGCDFYYTHSREILSHRRCHSRPDPADPENILFKCVEPSCGLYFNTVLERMTHQRVHRNFKGFICPIASCKVKKPFLSLESFHNHLEKHQKDRFVCPRCKHSLLNDSDNISAHKKTCQTKTTECFACQVKFENREELYQHTQKQEHKETFKKKFATQNLIEQGVIIEETSDWIDEITFIPAEPNDPAFKCDCSKKKLKYCPHSEFIDCRQIRFHNIVITIRGTITCSTSEGIYGWVFENDETHQLLVYVGKYETSFRKRSQQHLWGNDGVTMRSYFIGSNSHKYTRRVFPLFGSPKGQSYGHQFIMAVENLYQHALEAFDRRFGLNTADSRDDELIDELVSNIISSRMQKHD